MTITEARPAMREGGGAGFPFTFMIPVWTMGNEDEVIAEAARAAGENVNTWMRRALLEAAGALSPTAPDPHHKGSIEWQYRGGRFYQRHVGTKKWHLVKKFHATRARVELLMGLIQQSKVRR